MARKGTLRLPKLQHYSGLTIRLFSIISRILVGGILLLCRDAVGVFYIRLGQLMIGRNSITSGTIRYTVNLHSFIRYQAFLCTIFAINAMCEMDI